MWEIGQNHEVSALQYCIVVCPVILTSKKMPAQGTVSYYNSYVTIKKQHTKFLV
jgi:hypothetical protein